jgi:hypothetical protein
MPLFASPTETGDGLEQPNPRKHNEMRSKLLLISGLWRRRVLDSALVASLLTLGAFVLLLGLALLFLAASIEIVVWLPGHGGEAP